ncbi:MAG TPA: Na/Pi cotransporter family protein [Treponemataceae bacterium]|nr:Na/Pi cotransporter family protein [Treponemataceae bacterium]
MIANVIFISFKILGALGLFMYGMQLSSDGIQRAAGDRLQGTVNFMTKNRFFAVFTGIIVTILVQSSSATSVMVVAFVNAGLLTLVQSVGVMMGAHIGTTLTGWIIAAVGAQKFSIAIVAVPLFGVGYFMSLMKKRGDAFVSYGEGLMGFALIFLGLEFLANAIPDPSGDALLFLRDFSDKGWLAIFVCVAVGLVFTMLINASSATIAIVIGLASKGILTFDMAAALVLGSNVGTTFDAFLVSLGANTNGKRAAWAHIMINVVGTCLTLLYFHPFVALVDLITPGAYSAATAGAHIAMFHTMFNVVNTAIFLPLIPQYAAILSRVIKETPGEEERSRLVYRPTPLLGTPELNIAKARADIAELARVAEGLLERFREELSQKREWSTETMDWFARHREYASSLREGISGFLLEIAQQDIAEKTRDNIGTQLRMVSDFDGIAASCLSMACMQEKAARKKLAFGEELLGQLEPFTELAQEFLGFVTSKISHPLGEAELALAVEYESRVDGCRSGLKKIARKRITQGADVKTELQFIDLIRHIEKIGDNAYAVAVALREMK